MLAINEDFFKEEIRWVFIDIFPCDSIPDDPELLKKHSREAMLCRKILYARAAKYSADTRNPLSDYDLR